MSRKKEKLRPYRVDYIDFEEMRGNEVLMHSVIHRAVTALQARSAVAYEGGRIHSDRFILRAYRFYSSPPNGSWVAILDWFHPKKALEIMELSKAYRQPIPTIGDLPPANYKFRFGKPIDQGPQPPKKVVCEGEKPPGCKCQDCLDYRRANSKCPGCGIGIDNNYDGDCMVCTSPAYKQAYAIAKAEKRVVADTAIAPTPAASGTPQPPHYSSPNHPYIWTGAGLLIIGIMWILIRFF